MGETGQPSAAPWPTLPFDRQRTVLAMFGQIILRRIRNAPLNKEASDDGCERRAEERDIPSQDSPPSPGAHADSLYSTSTPQQVERHQESTRQYALVDRAFQFGW
jgi:hypothetical protein